MYYSQKLGEDFTKLCGLLRIYELYWYYWTFPFNLKSASADHIFSGVVTNMGVRNMSWKLNNHITLLVYVIQVKLKISQEIAIVDYANVTGCLLPGPTMGLKFRFHFPFFSQFFDEKINIWIAHRFSNVHGYKSGNFGEKSRENAGAWKLKCFFINYFKPLWLDGQQCSDQWLRWLLFMQKFISGSSKNDVTIF